MENAMNRAIDLSIANAKNRKGGPFASVILKNGLVISEGTNMVTSTNDPSAHGEIVAIRRACKVLNTHNLTGCELYTNCFCCPMCFACIRWARIDKIYYTLTRENADSIGFSDLEIYQEIKNMMNGEPIPTMIQIKDDRAIEAFKIWNSDKEKIKY
jgi:tRNA(Arg) A34 adenosine deaminase TadA